MSPKSILVVAESIDIDDSLDSRQKIEQKEEVQALHAERSDRIHAINQLLKAYTLFEKDIEFSLSEGIIWQEQNQECAHHEILKLPWGNYLGIVIQNNDSDTGSPLRVRENSMCLVLHADEK